MDTEIISLLAKAKLAMHSGDSKYREATEYLVSAAQRKVTQRQMAKHLEIPLGAVNALLAWVPAPGDCDHLFQLIATRRSN